MRGERGRGCIGWWVLRSSPGSDRGNGGRREMPGGSGEVGCGTYRIKTKEGVRERRDMQIGNDRIPLD